MIWLFPLTHAEIPLPSYREALISERESEVDERLREACDTSRFPVVCAEGGPDAAIAHADAFQDAVARDAGLEYLAGLANRYAGRDDRAVRRYEAALALDPGRVEAWYDLGEVRMSRADWAGAEQAFGKVAELRADGTLAWLGPWRLAEVAASRHDAEGFERHVKEALRRGFSFQHVKGLPNWRGFYADPALRDALDKLLTVYATPDVAESLR